MSKAHDIYSGLGEDASDLTNTQAGAAAGAAAESTTAAPTTEDDRRQQALVRARCIVETLENVKVWGGCEGGRARPSPPSPPLPPPTPPPRSSPSRVAWTGCWGKSSSKSFSTW